MNETLLALIKPVNLESTPSLNKYITRNARISMVLWSVLYLVTLVVGAFAPDFLKSGFWVGVSILTSLFCFGFSFSSFGKKHVEILFCLTWCIAGVPFAFSYETGLGTLAVLTLLSVACAPLKPSLYLLIGAANLVSLAIWHGGKFEVTTNNISLFLTIVSGTVSAMLISQMQRHSWEELDLKDHQLIAADRFSTLGQHMAGIAHEMKTPIAATMNEIQGLETLVDELSQSIGHPEVEDEDLREICTEIVGHINGVQSNTKRVSRFVTAIKEHTRDIHKSAAITFRVQERLDSIQALLEHRIKRSPVNLHTEEVDRSAKIVGDAGRFDQIIINLINNAFEACEESGAGYNVTLSVSQCDEGVYVAVHDDGPGVPEHLREKIFQPLFTTRAKSTGTGLGLAVCRDIVEKVFGGTLMLVDVPRGARFEVFVPHNPMVEETGEVSVTDLLPPGALSSERATLH